MEKEKNLTEYQQAQKSAEHHNNIMWNLIYIGMGLSILIFYTILRSNTEIIIYLKIGFLLFGILILFYFSNIIEKTNQKKEKMYQFCKDIENNKDFKNFFVKKIHTETEKLSLTNKIKGINLFRIIKIILFIVYLSGIIYLAYNAISNQGSELNILLILLEVIVGIIEFLIALIIEISWYWTS